MPRGGKPPRPFKPGAPQLPEVTRAKGVLALGRMALRIVQQQLQSMQGRLLDEEDRKFLIDSTKLLLDARKARHVITKDGPMGSTPLPPLEAKS